MLRRKYIRIAIGVILLFIASIGIYAYVEFNRKVVSTEDAPVAYQLSAQQLIINFENDGSSAKKFSGKVLEVIGRVKSVEHSESSAIVFLGEANSSTSVRCLLDSSSQSITASLQENQLITIKGICTGYDEDPLLGSDVVLNRCIILKHTK